MTNQSKGLLLVGLLLVWVGVMYVQLSDMPESTSPNSSDSILLSGDSLPPTKDLTLAKDFANPRQTIPFTPPRNIFAPIGYKPPSTAKKETAAVQATSIQKTPNLPTGPSPEELAAQRAREQLKKYRFLGYLTKGGESQAFLTNGQAIFIVKQGEMMEGKVQVHKIEPENIVLSTKVWETGNHIQATIPLTPETRG